MTNGHCSRKYEKHKKATLLQQSVLTDAHVCMLVIAVFVYACLCMWGGGAVC